MDSLIAYEEVACQLALLRSELETRRSQLLASVAPELAALDEEYTPALEAAQARLDELAGVVKSEVLAEGKSVKGELYHAVLVKGRESWDGKKLEGYAAVHPEVMQFRVVGAPSVTIRASK